MPRNPKSRKRGWHQDGVNDRLFPKHKSEKQAKPSPKPEPPPDGIDHAKKIREISRRARNRFYMRNARARGHVSIPDNTTASEQVLGEFEAQLEEDLKEQDEL